ncbi:MAG: CPBP family intramembrane glutamic endopeptidase, partial [Phycisphaeraceae bacterium]
LLESIVYVAPLFILQLLIQRAMQGSDGGELAGLWHGLLAATEENAGGAEGPLGDWRSGLLLSIGAGIYEELLFRLLAIALLGLLLEDILALPRGWAALLAVAVSSLAFAWYHFWGTGMPIEATRFAFYTLAGLYFAGLYMLRGFGIVVATHAFYDVVIVSVRAMADPGTG